MQTFIRKLSTACQIPLNHWIILIKSWFIMLYIRLRMDLTPFKSWKQWLINSPADQLRPLDKREESTVVNYRRMITLASRYHLITANCLPKSLALKWMLEKENIDSELKLGLNLDKNNFHGHAWLQRNEIVLNDNHDVALRYPLEQEISHKPISQ